MTDIEIFEIIQNIIEEKIGEEKENITLEADLFDDIGFDSLDVVEVVMEVEKEFNIAIPDDKIERVRTVQQYVDLVQQSVK